MYADQVGLLRELDRLKCRGDELRREYIELMERFRKVQDELHFMRTSDPKPMPVGKWHP